MKDSLLNIKPSEKYLVLIHGLGRSKFSMFFLEYYFRRLGFKTLNFGYNSKIENIEFHARALDTFLENNHLSKSKSACKINFITHSLGSLVLRKFIQISQNKYNFKRAVMLGPPNQGAKIARILQRYSLAKKIFGPILSEIANFTFYEELLPLEVGIICGGIKSRIGLNPFLGGDNDGLVTVAETKLSSAKDTLLLFGAHHAMFLSWRVAKQARYFLEMGEFSR